MSLDQARAFIEKIKSDDAFRDRISAIKEVDGRVAAARGAGFDFTEAEVKEAQSELSDFELDNAAGGGGGQFDNNNGDEPSYVVNGTRDID